MYIFRHKTYSFKIDNILEHKERTQALHTLHIQFKSRPFSCIAAF